jgi:hypothetical protein
MASVEFDEQLIDRLANRFLPKPRITHPWPSQRFRVKHPRREPYAWVHRIMSNHFISGVRIRRLFADVVPEQGRPTGARY